MLRAFAVGVGGALLAPLLRGGRGDGGGRPFGRDDMMLESWSVEIGDDDELIDLIELVMMLVKLWKQSREQPAPLRPYKKQKALMCKIFVFNVGIGKLQVAWILRPTRRLIMEFSSINCQLSGVKLHVED